ncbi:hypothetical protein LX32DRAFT_652673 [Colletotrichum zoysiae]|uniref:Uncharacterized protein n=1 Tax=Colletotrichum zoysiae TaxID=1216348 RepID=A0AAD9HH16_9PEZI|nr:hypothetical protein LX32DRAFT_652673 [Colletotrichum zoysiae]
MGPIKVLMRDIRIIETLTVFRDHRFDYNLSPYQSTVAGMKNKLAALPGLQAAAALYLARTSEARVFCADANRTVVPDANCAGADTPGQFFVFGKDVADVAPGTQVEPGINIYDASDAIMRQNARFPPPSPPPPPRVPAPQKPGSLVLRDDDDDYYCDQDDNYYHPYYAFGPRYIVGYYGRGISSWGG